MREGELEFDFLNRLVEKLGDIRPKPHGLQLVDFLLEEHNRLILIEIKDPSCKPRGNDTNAMGWVQKNRSRFSAKTQ